MKRIVIILLSMMIMLNGCAVTTKVQRAPVPTAVDEAAIRATVADYVAAVNAGDVQRYAAFFETDALIMPPDHGIIRGRDALLTYAQPIFNQFAFDETVVVRHISVAGDWAGVAYTYNLTLTAVAGGETIRDQGKGVSLLRRGADGTWKWTHTAWNGDGIASPAE